ncbi:SRPBCC family protein [Pseudobacter ginsenosidimutans]|jgi:ligand-binding SRPBCC domain-containing protein|uniref:Ligand-binding SRPBCC domain-containing protein n=1 Tax=Pseudobacter ginsenosidimutans TaxID=661488 RepID=A0A4Q7MU97_9BACT|nr:SRPBCC family protein [Pseudobacter ginsenosidimutans]QEC41680.1 SRPBCC family protein [Pseudobacter ginsenosidimutans]RZS71519.1 ligand-binding SRPBCC domain-containing protein [Pseudobacter ginsenosidimutans]
MAHHSIKAVQRIPISVDEAWRFFSVPENLVRITPADFSFQIISHHHGGQIYQGQIIEYNVRPLWNIPWYWMTEITHVQPQQYFVDEQRYGPFGIWHHQHHFAPVDGGVEMTDIVHYSVPGWWFGSLVNKLVVGKKLEALFRYRFGEIEKMFGKWEGQSCNVKMY